jgi:threonine/homoserine/homoserine lactone efflux protein
MHNYWPEFLTVALIHFLAVASPGPDFAVVLRQALCQSQTNARATALGVGLGILVHVGYSLLGIGLIIQQSVWLFNVLKVIGALYLTWIAIHCLRARAGGIHVEARPDAGQTGLAALRLGFLTNVLNPKATLFFCVPVFRGHQPGYAHCPAGGLWPVHGRRNGPLVCVGCQFLHAATGPAWL